MKNENDVDRERDELKLLKLLIEQIWKKNKEKGLK